MNTHHFKGYEGKKEIRVEIRQARIGRVKYLRFVEGIKNNVKMPSTTSSTCRFLTQAPAIFC